MFKAIIKRVGKKSPQPSARKIFDAGMRCYEKPGATVQFLVKSHGVTMMLELDIRSIAYAAHIPGDLVLKGQVHTAIEGHVYCDYLAEYNANLGIGNIKVRFPGEEPLL